MQTLLSKYNGMGYVKMHSFHSNPLYGSQVGIYLQMQSYLGFYLFLTKGEVGMP